MSLIFTFLFLFLKPSGVTQKLPSNTPYLQHCERRGNHCSGFGVVYVLVPDGTHTLSTREYLFSASCFASPEEKQLLRFFSSGDLALVFQPLSRPESRSFSKVAFLSFLFPQGTEGLFATSVFQQKNCKSSGELTLPHEQQTREVQQYRDNCVESQAGVSSFYFSQLQSILVLSV